MTPPFQSSAAGGPLPVALRSLADLLEAGPVADLPDAVTTELVLGAIQVSGQVDAVVTRAIGVFDAKTIWRGDGSKSLGGWLASHTELSQARAGGIGATARDLRACPVIEAAYEAGAIGTAKVRLLLGATQPTSGSASATIPTAAIRPRTRRWPTACTCPRRSTGASSVTSTWIR